MLLLFCHQGIFWSCRQSIFEEMQKRFSQVVVCVACVCVCLQHGDSFDTNSQMKTSGKNQLVRGEAEGNTLLQADGNLSL